MRGLFDMISLDVRNIPHVLEDPKVFRVLSHWISGEVTLIRPFIGSLPWIFRFDSDIVQIEYVIITFRVPQDSFITTAEPVLAMETMAKMPYDPVAKL
jgi:hypothetical protein